MDNNASSLGRLSIGKAPSALWRSSYRSSNPKGIAQVELFLLRGRIDILPALKGKDSRPHDQELSASRKTAMLNGKSCYIGSFHTPEEAGKAYNDFALTHHGEFLYQGDAA
jgi:hypothetical protein